MAWESRGPKGRQYLYLSVRDDSSRVVKRYVGNGVQAQRAAEALADRRNRREADRQAVLDAQSRLLGADKLLTDLDEAATVLLEAFLLSEGFHRINYSRWRRNRNVQGRKQSAAPGGGTGRD
jgi:hypothetical protein